MERFGVAAVQSRPASRRASFGSLAVARTEAIDNGNGATKGAQSLVECPDDARIERVVRNLNTLCKTATFDFAIAVGKVVIDGVYGGDLSAWRSRRRKSTSFRALARHPDLPMSPSALCRSVAIYELSCRLNVQRWKHISTSHIRLVLPLPAASQGGLLERADLERWSVDHLRAQIALGSEPLRKHTKARARGSSSLHRTIRAVDGPLGRLEAILNADRVLTPVETQMLTDLLDRLERATAGVRARASRSPSIVDAAPAPELSMTAE
jgi:hypothetical protein